MVYQKKNEDPDEVEKVLKKFNSLTITEIVKKTKLTRSSVRTALAQLYGAKKVSLRHVGMAKLYTIKV